MKIKLTKEERKYKQVEFEMLTRRYDFEKEMKLQEHAHEQETNLRRYAHEEEKLKLQIQLMKLQLQQQATALLPGPSQLATLSGPASPQVPNPVSLVLDQQPYVFSSQLENNAPFPLPVPDQQLDLTGYSQSDFGGDFDY